MQNQNGYFAMVNLLRKLIAAELDNISRILSQFKIILCQQ